jgi:hypothetical protein
MTALSLRAGQPRSRVPKSGRFAGPCAPRVGYVAKVKQSNNDMTPFTINESEPSPNPPVSADALTPYQRRNMKFYLRYREQRMTLFGLLWANRRMHLILLTAFAAYGLLVYFVYGGLGAAFVAVAWISAFLRDIAIYSHSAKVWPVMQKVIDWKKVEALASADDSRKV